MLAVRAVFHHPRLSKLDSHLRHRIPTKSRQPPSSAQRSIGAFPTGLHFRHKRPFQPLRLPGRHPSGSAFLSRRNMTHFTAGRFSSTRLCISGHFLVVEYAYVVRTPQTALNAWLPLLCGAHNPCCRWYWRLRIGGPGTAGTVSGWEGVGAAWWEKVLVNGRAVNDVTGRIARGLCGWN